MLFFFYGAGHSGKSTFVDLLCFILSDYAATLSIDSFSRDNKRGGEATPDRRLPDARLVAAFEQEAGAKLKNALITTLTYGEKIPVRACTRISSRSIRTSRSSCPATKNHASTTIRTASGAGSSWCRGRSRSPSRHRPGTAEQAARRGLRGLCLDGGRRGRIPQSRADIPPGVRAASKRIQAGKAMRSEPSSGPPAMSPAIPTTRKNRSTSITPSKSAERSFEGPDGQMKQFQKARSNGETFYRGIVICTEWQSQGDER
ncbi:hypothetical protein NKH61_26810 [Mesorhizobium sp. M1005]|uniref:hypothetical protein n=1 Tax=unclassified Mesorhizobium TaxID=325217 RepID=UPI003339F1F8